MAYNPVLAAGNATSANASPIVIASDQVNLSPVPSIFTAVTLTRVANTTTYVAGQVVFSTTATGQVVTTTCQMAKITNQAFTALRATIKTTAAVTVNGIFRVHLYNSQPTLTSGDGSTWLTTSGGYIDSFDVTMQKIFSDGAVGVGIPSNGSIINSTPASGTNYVYVVLEARAAYVPTSSEVFTISFEVQ